MFIERLNSLMEEHGVTRTKLLSDLKMGKNQFRVWETGGKPNSSTISAIATYFNVSPDYLTGNDVLMDRADLILEANDNSISEQEKALLTIFRSASEENRLRIIQAVLNIADSEKNGIHTVYRAARSTDNTEHCIEGLPTSAIDSLKTASPVTSEEDL